MDPADAAGSEIPYPETTSGRLRMGEAKRRRAEIEAIKNAYVAWLSTLSPIEHCIAQTAKLAHERIVERMGVTGACYLLAFFLGQYLRREKSVEVETVIGYVNDTTSALMSSHAWIEYNGKVTDISLTRTEYAQAQPRGHLLILGRIVYPGEVAYSYHRERSPEALDFLRGLEKLGPLGPIQHKEQEHQQMASASRSDSGALAYLNAAPPDRTYAALKRLLES